MTLAYIESRIRQSIDDSVSFEITAAEHTMCHTSLASGEYGKRPDSDAPYQHRGEGGLPSYGNPEAIWSGMASAFNHNHNVQIDPGELLNLALYHNGRRFFPAICGCYNVARNLAGYERNNINPPSAFQADRALANIRPPNDPHRGDKAGPVYHLFGIGVVTLGISHEAAQIGAGLQQLAANTNTADRFKHHEVGVWAVDFFYRLMREHDFFYNVIRTINLNPLRLIFG